MSMETQSIYYPRMLRRVQAMLIDSLFIAALLYAIAFLPPMEDWSFIKPLLFCLGVFVLEPGMVSFTGGTIGQHILKIRVTRRSGQGNINLLAATVRFILKATLGWFSLVVVMTSQKHQALHDLAARSLVVYKSTQHLPAHEKLVDRPSLNDTYVMPARWRRLVVTIGYFVINYVCYCAFVMVVVSRQCLSRGRCPRFETVIVEGSTLLWLFIACAVIVLGWRGQLYGARRTTRVVE